MTPEEQEEQEQLIDCSPEGKLVETLIHLRTSERGTRALADFRKLMKNGGSGLDRDNWKALCTLCALMADYGLINEFLDATFPPPPK